MKNKGLGHTFSAINGVLPETNRLGPDGEGSRDFGHENQAHMTITLYLTLKKTS